MNSDPSDNKDINDEKVKDNVGYSLTNDNKVFTSRVDSIFGSLDSLEQKHNEAIKDFKFLDEELEETDDAAQDNGESKVQKSENMSRRKRKRAPGFVSNPNKWKKYSLKDDGTSKFSGLTPDELNSKVAADLMKDLEMVKEKDLSPIIKPKEENDGNILFKVPELPVESTNGEKKSYFKSSHGGSARCMETFEFGKSKKRISAKIKNIENETCSKSQTISFKEQDSENDKDETSTSNDASSVVIEDNANEHADIKFKSKGGKIRKRNIRKPLSEDDD